LYPVAPYVLVVLYMCLQLIPMVAGSVVYQLVIVRGVATHAYEVTAWLVLALGLTLVSLYLITSTLLALIVATLPDMTPVRALRIGKKLVVGRRWLILRKLLFLPLVLVIVTAIILLPLILIVPPLAPVFMIFMGPLLFAISHSYIYALYRELVDGQATE